MGHHGEYSIRAPFKEPLGRLRQGTARNRKIVDDQRRPSLNLPDDLQNLGRFVVRVALLVCDRQRSPEVRGITACVFHKSSIRR